MGHSKNIIIIEDVMKQMHLPFENSAYFGDGDGIIQTMMFKRWFIDFEMISDQITCAHMKVLNVLLCYSVVTLRELTGIVMTRMATRPCAFKQQCMT